MLRHKPDHLHCINKNRQKVTPLHSMHHINFSSTANSGNGSSSSTNNNIRGSNYIINNRTSGSALDALPKQFVFSMKKLFDILDDRHCGFVKFSDIENGWQDDGCKGLPRGVIESLRTVTPANGLLSFDRFCAGLKICLLRNQTEGAERSASKAIKPMSFKAPRPPSAPLLEIENPVPSAPWNSANCISSVPPIHPQRIVGAQRTLSLPQLSPAESDLAMELDLKVESGGSDSTASGSEVVSNMNNFNSPPPPPKPPRSVVPKVANGIGLPSKSTDKSKIRNALQNWQMGLLLNEMENTKDIAWKQFPSYRGCADGGSSSTNEINMPSYVKKTNCNVGNSKRREPRRHTLQNGIDYNMLKRLKQYEEERAVLLLGLNAVDKARDWYIQQLSTVKEKLQYLGRMGDAQAQWSEVQQEHLNFQRARVLEVNRSLATLTETWERACFPTHFNLALSSAPMRSTSSSSVLLDRLRQQNRHLADEVSLKGDRITLLEGEKQALLREMFLLQQRIPERVEGRLIDVLGQASPVCSSSSGGLGDADVVY